MVLDRAPSWLGWTGLVIGGITMLAAVGPFLIPSLFQASSCTGCGARLSRSSGWWRWDRDAATRSRSTGRGCDRVTGRRRCRDDGSPRLVLPPVVASGACIRLASPRANLRPKPLPLVTQLATQLPMWRTGFVGVRPGEQLHGCFPGYGPWRSGRSLRKEQPQRRSSRRPSNA